MPGIMIILLPPWPGDAFSWDAVAADLADHGQPVLQVPALSEQSVGNELDLAGAWVAHCALEIARSRPAVPLLMVACGASARMLAAVGFSQRASGRKVAGYVVLDGDLPSGGLQDWPDAPVAYLGQREATLAELRGWDVQPADDLVKQLLAIAERSV